MDSFEFNKIAGAVLAAALVLVSLNVFYNPGETGGHDVGAGHVKAGFVLPAAETATPPANSTPSTQPATTSGGAAQGDPAIALLASADAANGKKLFKKCKACHKTNKGGANGVGPNLWGIVGRDKGVVANYKYSKALLKKGGKWTYESLVAFLTKPKAFIPGTKMSFGGFKKAKDRANLTAFLRSLADNPVPLP